MLFAKIQAFFLSNTFTSNARLKLEKKSSKCGATPRGWTFLFENYSHFSATLLTKNNSICYKNKQKNNCVCIHGITWLIIMKMKMKMKNRSPRYGTNRPRSRHRHKYSKYIKFLSMMILICIKQHQSNIWSSIYENVKQHWGWVD